MITAQLRRCIRRSGSVIYFLVNSLAFILCALQLHRSDNPRPSRMDNGASAALFSGFGFGRIRFQYAPLPSPSMPCSCTVLTTRGHRAGITAHLRRCIRRSGSVIYLSVNSLAFILCALQLHRSDNPRPSRRGNGASAALHTAFRLGHLPFSKLPRLLRGGRLKTTKSANVSRVFRHRCRLTLPAFLRGCNLLNSLISPTPPDCCADFFATLCRKGENYSYIRTIKRPYTPGCAAGAERRPARIAAAAREYCVGGPRIL